MLRVKLLPRWLKRKRVYLQCGRPGFNLYFGKIPWRRKWQAPPVFLPGKSHGWKNLAGHKESDMTERLQLLCIRITSHEIFMKFLMNSLFHVVPLMPPTSLFILSFFLTFIPLTLGIWDVYSPPFWFFICMLCFEPIPIEITTYAKLLLINTHRYHLEL